MTEEERAHIERRAAAHRRLMKLFNPATARDWMEERRKEGSKFVRKETRKTGT